MGQNVWRYITRLVFYNVAQASGLNHKLEACATLGFSPSALIAPAMFPEVLQEALKVVSKIVQITARRICQGGISGRMNFWYGPEGSAGLTVVFRHCMS